MTIERECRCVARRPSGALVLEIEGRRQDLTLVGVEPPQPLPPEWQLPLLGRLPRAAHPPRCTFQVVDGARRALGTVRIFAWSDKSGNVWEDLGALLIEEGLARVASGSFPQREAYERRQRLARSARRGIWAPGTLP